jgi:peptidoglycan/xylan/chitin deacetylase (PgdA/CDA1 family)
MRLRIDRLVTLYVANPLRRCSFNGKGSIPILMYHNIADEDESGVHPYYRIATSPRVFAQHMEYLHDLGYGTISVGEAVNFLHNPGSAKKYAVVTFDDGYADFYRQAFPVLSRYGFSATVFLPTAHIGVRPVQFKGRDCLTWAEVRELSNHRILFGSHTVTHPQLSALEASAVKNEIANSKQTIEDNLGESVDSFAYPFAFPEENTPFVRTLRGLLVESGYRQGVSTRIGTARRREDRYFLRRLPMNSLDDVSLFSAKLQGGYDWLHTIQYGSKLLMRRSR